MITLLGDRDPWSLIAFAMRERDRFKGNGLVHSLMVVDGEKTHPQYNGGKGWAALRIAINHAMSIVAKSPLEMISAEVEALDPRAGTPWRENKEIVQVRIGIRCNKAAWLCWPPSYHNLLPGQIALIPAGWFSAVNLGETQVVSLVLSLRQRKAEEEPA